VVGGEAEEMGVDICLEWLEIILNTTRMGWGGVITVIWVSKDEVRRAPILQV